MHCNSSPHAANDKLQLIWNNIPCKCLFSPWAIICSASKQIFVSWETNICRALPQDLAQSAVLINSSQSDCLPTGLIHNSILLSATKQEFFFSRNLFGNQTVDFHICLIDIFLKFAFKALVGWVALYWMEVLEPSVSTILLISILYFLAIASTELCELVAFAFEAIVGSVVLEPSHSTNSSHTGTQAGRSHQTQEQVFSYSC